MSTDYHAKYFAHELTKRHSAQDDEKLTGAMLDAQVDLNPHQVEAALFAFGSPLSKGAILADEVGLGKTIEAGLVISQWWAERKRRILIITPANLRKQWLQELQEKFFLTSRILETKSFNQALKDGQENPFVGDEIVICSYHFARNKSREVGLIPWDLVVIDEAHRLRNVYRRSNKIANELRNTLFGRPKILLTATPLQNSLLELYGLVSFIDEYTFGDVQSFREQFSDLSNPLTFQRLKERIKPVCRRTLRSQVLPYISYTKRHPILEHFEPTEDEETLYEMVSEYLRKPELLALPTGQRQLITLVLRKLLASSSYAIAGAVDKMANRLQQKLDDITPENLTESLDEDFEHLDEIEDEWEEEEAQLNNEEREALKREISELRAFYDLAVSIENNAKGDALLKALDKAFERATQLGAERKALIFTESRRTQDYLLELFSTTPYENDVVLFNGSNSDKKSREIYNAWLAEYRDTDRVTGSRTADMRSAIVDYFREQGKIMIATEAGAEGINLQFCSLVINYDLPWNPQRVEQRIGRCHRYGQKHDVVVVNFLNNKNQADRRVLELLDEKFQLFKGVFGASDEVLGAVESGVAFEKRIAGIYQDCRTSDEINDSFDRLQEELSGQIEDAVSQARQSLLEHFDDEVKEKLRLRDDRTKEYLTHYERRLIALTKYELAESAQFLDDSSFQLNHVPFTNCDIPLGLYELPRRSGEAHFYRLAHPLAKNILVQAKNRDLPNAELLFDYGSTDNKITALENLSTKSGWLMLSLLSVTALDQAEDRLIWVGVTDSGDAMEEELLPRLFSLPARVIGPAENPPQELIDQTTQLKHDMIEQISRRNAEFFEAEINKLETWADDRKITLEREIKEFDRRIKEARRSALAATSLEEKLTAQKDVKALEKERSTRRRTLFEAQDEIDEQRDKIIEETEERLTQKEDLTTLFSVRWRLSI